MCVAELPLDSFPFGLTSSATLAASATASATSTSTSTAHAGTHAMAHAAAVLVLKGMLKLMLLSLAVADSLTAAVAEALPHAGFSLHPGHHHQSLHGRGHSRQFVAIEDAIAVCVKLLQQYLDRLIHARSIAVSRLSWAIAVSRLGRAITVSRFGRAITVSRIGRAAVASLPRTSSALLLRAGNCFGPSPHQERKKSNACDKTHLLGPLD